jgi:diadenosine tetraphosphate (Ap4A) HIT family hydrolase
MILLKTRKKKKFFNFLKQVSNIEGGYRTLTNVGQNGGQEVPHLHFHIFGGEKVGKMVSN